MNGFGLEQVLDFSRHASVSTLMVYRDCDECVQGQIAELISAKIERTKSNKLSALFILETHSLQGFGT